MLEPANRRTTQHNKEHMKTNCETLAGDLRTVVDDAEDLLKSTAGKFTDEVRTARGKLREAVEKGKKACESLEKRARLGAQAADRTVRDHPYEAVGISLIVGLLAGV